MKPVILLSAAAMSFLTQWPLSFSSDASGQIQPFTAAPQVAIYVLED